MMSASPPDIARLARLAGMLGSDHAGEAHNAARLVTRELRQAGFTWADVFGRAFALPPAPPKQQRAPDDADMLREVRAHLRMLTPWEAEFSANLLEWRGRWTPKQRVALRAIHARVAGRG